MTRHVMMNQFALSTPTTTMMTVAMMTIRIMTKLLQITTRMIPIPIATTPQRF
jgi:hypothetical protein